MDKELTTLFTGRQHTVLVTVDSTNSYLSEMLRTKPVPEGTVVSAVSQKAGRGQSGARWSSDEGKNLLLSFVFYPSFLSPKQIFSLSQAYALGVYDFASHYFGNNIRIKWPNDIYWLNKKLAGILVENSMNSAAVSYSIAGIGINVNQTNFPANIPNPISFSLIKPSIYDINLLFIQLCNAIEKRYLQLKAGQFAEIDKDYHKALFRKGDWAWYEDKNGKFPGCILGVEPNGKLRIEDELGEIRVYDIKEVAFVC